MKLFSKNLTATDCLKRLSIPRRVLTFLPKFHGGHAVDLRVRCETMEYWPLVCTIRKKGRYEKPVISKGWRKFVLRNNLNVGDEVTLYKEEDEESGSLHFRVEVKRATRPSRASFQSPPCLDLGVDEASGTTSCTDQTSVGIRATDETNNTLFKQLTVDVSDAVDVNNIQENTKSQYNKEQEREYKLFGAIIGCGLLVGARETTDQKAYSLKQFISLSAGGAELVNGFRSESTAKAETTVLGHFNLGLTVGGPVVHVHDQAVTSSTSFHKTDQKVGFELDMILGQSIGDHRSVVNLDLTLEPPILFNGKQEVPS